MSIIKLLSKKVAKALFTTPSHNQKPSFNKNYSSFYEHDFSEIEGFDNLSNPKSSILLAQGKASEILGTKQTYFITQGATTALLAAMKAIINPADKVLVARNCHKSVYNGLILTASMVDWFIPESNEDWGFYTHISEEKLESTLQLNQYKAFIMTSPTYEGINSNIEKISQICKKYNVFLIVDEAHGALYNFSHKLPKSAIEQGADITINSLHKTAGALNQTALLNINKDIRNIELNEFQNAINLFQTTSPSYPLLRNIEECLTYLNSKQGKNEIDKLLIEIKKFKDELKHFDIDFYEASNQDITKIILRKNGLNCSKLSEILYNEFDIEDEMNSSNYCLFLTGIGTKSSKLNKLKNALKKIENSDNYEFEKYQFQPYPLVKIQPINAFNRDYKFVNKDEAILKISNKIIMPYPPGIGLLYPGEAIQEWHLKYLEDDVEIMV
ncbi:MAG: aminotransferase class I/II-fold pyridoxal phosphate-dependent enzyme [Cyanobacteria bacterium SIG27]|nr:aminotransferase class I/II-fold pyridoxal phosphate-dependent enzyme [Cyanobacteria bacterium SIG27]